QPGYSRPRAHPARPAVTTVRENPAPKETEKPAAKETPAPPAPPARRGSGVITITVSLNKQKLAVYSDGVAVLRSQVSTGRATPPGVFSIIQKDRWHHTDTGDSPFMQRITWSGIGLHQAAANGPAAPSSIRLPEPLAKQLWGMTKVGT